MPPKLRGSPGSMAVPQLTSSLNVNLERERDLPNRPILRSRNQIVDLDLQKRNICFSFSRI